MPIKAKYNGSYKDITDLMNVDKSIDYVLAKTSSSYKRVYTATRSIEDAPPTTFKSIKPGANLTDYRIYGQTVDGESVGDRTENTLPMSTTPISTNIDDFHCEYDGMGTITLTATKDNANFSSFTIPLKEDFIIPISVGQGGNGCLQFNNDKAYFDDNTAAFVLCFNFNNTRIDGWSLLEVNRITYSYAGMGGRTINNISIEKQEQTVLHLSKGDKLTIQPAFYNNGTTEQAPFEPYGYKVPMAVSDGTDTLTTNLYLPEQIKKVGDEAEYIDYGEQKQHRVRKNLLPNTATSQTVNGITFTVNSDGSVTCNGTANNVVLYEIYSFPHFSGECILSGCPMGGSQNTYRLQYTNLRDLSYKDYGTGVNIYQFDEIQYPTSKINIRIESGYTCNNLTFYPMIRKADIEDDTYEPYIENTEVDVTLPALPTFPGTNVLSVSTEVQPSKIDITGHIKTISGGS